MSEKEKQIIQTLADKLPAMSERERGYLAMGLIVVLGIATWVIFGY